MEFLNKNFIICGPTASGKSTAAKRIIKDEGLDGIVTYTTRPMRKGEVDGVDYHFISDEKFEELVMKDFFMENVAYETVHGRWRYGSSKDSFSKIDNDRLIVLNYDGVEAVIKAYDRYPDLYNKPVIIFIEAPAPILKERAVHRGDDINEVVRRLADDEKIYHEKKIDRHVDYYIDGRHSIDSVVKEIKKIIKGDGRWNRI